MLMQLLATYHCDQAYAFDISSTGSCSTSYGAAKATENSEGAEALVDMSHDASHASNGSMTEQTSNRQVMLMHITASES